MLIRHGDRDRWLAGTAIGTLAGIEVSVAGRLMTIPTRLGPPTDKQKKIINDIVCVQPTAFSVAGRVVGIGLASQESQRMLLSGGDRRLDCSPGSGTGDIQEIGEPVQQNRHPIKVGFDGRHIGPAPIHRVR